METVWSNARQSVVNDSVFDEEEGYLYLRDDPKSWIESNQNKLLLVRKLELYLYGKDELEEIQESSIDELKELTHLYISWGRNLKFLPNSITKLHKLQVLKIDNCGRIKELPRNLGYLDNLTHLELFNCDKIAKLPENMGRLDNLTYLKLYNCDKLAELPASMARLKNLTRVSLIDCYKIKSLSNVMEVLLKLEILEISGCFSLKEVPPNAIRHYSKNRNDIVEDSAKALNASRSTSSRPLKERKEARGKFIVKATYKDDTVKFNFSPTSTIDELHEEVGKRFKLEVNNFKIKYRDAENDLLLLTSIDELRDVSISSKSNTVEVHVLDDDEGYLCLRDDPSKWIECNRAKRLSVRKLKLDFSKSRGLKEIGDSIVELEKLTHLHISGGDNLNCLPNTITRLHNLKVLEICCFRLKELPENLGDLKCLTQLSLKFCLNITNLPESMGKLKSLTHLSLYFCVELTELPESLGQLKGLTHVSLFGCSKIESLSNVRETFENLASLEISKCSSIKDLPPNAFEDEKERIEIPPEVMTLLIGKNMALEDNIKPIKELKSEIYQSDPPQCQREIPSKGEDLLASIKGEKMVSDACSPVKTECSLLPYEKMKNKLHKRDMDTGISVCTPIHTEPLIEICAVTINSKQEFKIYGEIYVGGGDKKQLIYKRNQDDYETITSGGSLLLNGLDSNVVPMVDPIEMTIKLKNLEEKDPNKYFADGKIKLDTTATSCYQNPQNLTLNSTLGDVKVSYIVVPCGVVADVEVRIVKKVGDQEVFVDDAHIIFGTIKTRYGCSTDYPWSVLYQKQEHECDQVSYGESIELCRSLVCLPAYSSLLVDVDISLKESSTAETTKITGSKDFKCTERPPVEKNISEGNFVVIVTVYWGSSYQLQSHQKSQSPPSIHESMPLEKSLFGNSRIEVLSIFVGTDEGDKTIDEILCGTILVDHWDGFSYIFRNDDENHPKSLQLGKEVSLKGLMSYRTDQIYMYLRLKYCKVDNHEEDSKNMAINSCFLLNDYYYEHISRQWFDRPLCSVIMGNNAFAAVHYIVFKDAVKATLKICVTEKDSSSRVAGAFLFVYGNVVASYGAYKYSTQYEKDFCRSILFKEPEKNNSCQLPEDGEIPLFRNVVSVPMGSSLIVDVDLHASLRPNGVTDGNFENLEYKVILEIGNSKSKEIVLQGFKLLFSIEWADG